MLHVTGTSSVHPPLCWPSCQLECDVELMPLFSAGRISPTPGGQLRPTSGPVNLEDVKLPDTFFGDMDDDARSGVVAWESNTYYKLAMQPNPSSWGQGVHVCVQGSWVAGWAGWGWELLIWERAQKPEQEAEQVCSAMQFSVFAASSSQYMLLLPLLELQHST